MSNPEFTAPNFTTQTAAAYKANLDAAIASNGGDAINLGFSYAVGTGTFTVHGHNGSSLAAANPGFVKFQDPDNPGYSKYISVEANQDFIDDNGASEIINNTFGLTTGVAYTNDVPFYLYAVSNDAMDAVAFMISRVPGMSISPVVGNIGAPDDAVADSQFNFFSLVSLDEALYDANPCTMIGSFRMQMSSSDDWTVQTIDGQDGIGQYQEGRLFIQGTGTFGNATGKHMPDNGGTAPVFSTNTIRYQIEKNGYCTVYVDMYSDGGTDGSGATASLIGIPYTTEDNTNTSFQYTGSTMLLQAAGAVSVLGLLDYRFVNGNQLGLWEPTLGTVLHNDFTAGDRAIRFTHRLKMQAS